MNAHKHSTLSASCPLPNACGIPSAVCFPYSLSSAHNKHLEPPRIHLITHRPLRRPKQLQLLFMMIGRLVHYAFDAAMVSTVLAGVRRSSGFTYVHLYENYCRPFS